MQYKYSPSAEGEKDRLFRQSNSYFKFDLAAIDEATAGRKGLSALDLGCANGELTFSRMSDERFARVVGVDIDLKALDEASKRADGTKFRFLYHDLEHIDELARAEGKFDLAFGALVLHHLSDPEKFLVGLKACLADGGKLILRCSDDGGKMCHPHGDLLDEFLLRYDRAIASTDRFMGRKLFGLLTKAGYGDVKMRYHVADTCGKDRAARENMYDIGFGFRKKALENLTDVSERSWLLSALDRLHEAFQSPDFWYSNTTYIAIAEV